MAALRSKCLPLRVGLSGKIDPGVRCGRGHLVHGRLCFGTRWSASGRKSSTLAAGMSTSSSDDARPAMASAAAIEGPSSRRLLLTVFLSRKCLRSRTKPNSCRISPLISTRCAGNEGEALDAPQKEDAQKEDVARRLDFIRVQISDLGKFGALTREVYTRDRDLQRNVERLAENIAGIDIAKVLLVGEDAEMPNSYREIDYSARRPRNPRAREPRRKWQNMPLKEYPRPSAVARPRGRNPRFPGYGRGDHPRFPRRRRPQDEE